MKSWRIQSQKKGCLRLRRHPGQKKFSSSAALCELDGLADVGGRRKLHEAGLGVGWNIEFGNELPDRFRSDALAAGEGLELFVWMRNAVAAHYGLDGFGEDFPCVVEVFGDAGFVYLQLGQAAGKSVVADEGVAECNAEVSKNRGVGEVALPAGDRQLACEVAEEGVGDSEVAFGVFEVDRIYLVRHRGGTDFSFLELLLEEAHGDVAPDVAVEVEQDRVGAFDFMEEFSHVVVRFDLDRVGVEDGAQAFFNDLAAEGFPVEVRIGDEVGVVVADRAVHLCVDLDRLDCFDDSCKTHGDVGEFLADGRRRSSLAVGAGEHRDFSPFLGVSGDHAVDLFKECNESLAAFDEHEGVGGVVDVFGSAGEVHEFGCVLQFLVVGDLILDPVLNGLDVVVGRLLDGLDGFAVSQAEVVGEAAQERLSMVGKVRQFGESGFGKSDEPFNFDANSGVHECALGEDSAELVGLAGVASIDWGKSGERIEFRHFFDQ